MRRVKFLVRSSYSLSQTRGLLQTTTHATALGNDAITPAYMEAGEAANIYH